MEYARLDPDFIATATNMPLSETLRSWGYNIVPIAADKYREKHTNKNDVAHEEFIPPLTVEFILKRPPDGWTAYIHPEGVTYFYHPKRRVFTDANLYDDDVSSRIEEYINLVFDFIHRKKIDLPLDADLVLDYIDNPKPEDGHTSDSGSQRPEPQTEIVYYFADRKSKYIFWLDPYPLASLYEEIKGEEESEVTEHPHSHIKYWLESEFWTHCELFPICMNHPYYAIAIQDLTDTIMHHIGDSLTSRFSTAPIKDEELHDMLRLVNNMRENMRKDSAESLCTVARFMALFARHKFLNLHGQNCARPAAEQKRFDGNLKNRSRFMAIMSPLCLYAPDTHFARLKNLWVNHASYDVLSDAIVKLTNEWQDLIINAAVLLNANISFLSINSIDTSDGRRSAAQICSYVSLLSSIGCVIIGLLLVRWTKDGASVAGPYLMNRSKNRYGLEILCIVYGLPYTTLMWGMILFFAAFSLSVYQTADTSTRIVVSVMSVSLILLIASCVWSERPEEGGLSGLVTRLRNVRIGLIKRLFPSRSSSSSFKMQTVTPRGPEYV